MEEIQGSKVRIHLEDMIQLIPLITEAELNRLMISKGLMNLETRFWSRKFPKDLMYQEEKIPSINHLQVSGAVVLVEDLGVLAKTISFDCEWMIEYMLFCPFCIKFNQKVKWMNKKYLIFFIIKKFVWFLRESIYLWIKIKHNK